MVWYGTLPYYVQTTICDQKSRTILTVLSITVPYSKRCVTEIGNVEHSFEALHTYYGTHLPKASMVEFFFFRTNRAISFTYYSLTYV